MVRIHPYFVFILGLGDFSVPYLLVKGSQRLPLIVHELSFLRRIRFLGSSTLTLINIDALGFDHDYSSMDAFCFHLLAARVRLDWSLVGEAIRVRNPDH